jgi:hypothetical protein
VRRRMLESMIHRAVVTDANRHAVTARARSGGRPTPSRYVEVPAN